MSCPTDYSPLRCRARKIVFELRCCHVGAVFCCTAARPLLAHSGADLVRRHVRSWRKLTRHPQPIRWSIHRNLRQAEREGGGHSTPRSSPWCAIRCCLSLGRPSPLDAPAGLLWLNPCPAAFPPCCTGCQRGVGQALRRCAVIIASWGSDHGLSAQGLSAWAMLCSPSGSIRGVPAVSVFELFPMRFPVGFSGKQ
jgi:hypothetical protein